MANEQSVFGIKSILRNYGINGFLADSIIPVVLSLCIYIGIVKTSGNLIVFIQIAISYSIDVIPAIIGFVLAAYAIFLSYFSSNFIHEMIGTDEGKSLYQSLNSYFAICLIGSTISLLSSLIISFIIEMNIEICCAEVINSIVVFLLLYIILFSLFNIFNIIIDAFNCAQTLLFKGENNTNHHN